MLIQSVNAAAVPQAAPERPARPAGIPVAAAPEASAEAALRQAIEAANESLRAASSTVEFSIAKDVGKTVVRVIDRETHELIRQIPSEEMLAIARSIDRLQGLLLHGKA